MLKRLSSIWRRKLPDWNKDARRAKRKKLLHPPQRKLRKKAENQKKMSLIPKRPTNKMIKMMKMRMQMKITARRVKKEEANQWNLLNQQRQRESQGVLTKENDRLLLNPPPRLHQSNKSKNVRNQQRKRSQLLQGTLKLNLSSIKSYAKNTWHTEHKSLKTS